MKKDKKVIARFYGKGFSVNPREKIKHSSTQIFLDKDLFLESEGDNTGMDILNGFSAGIYKALKSGRVKPGSLRITFQILEK